MFLFRIGDDVLYLIKSRASPSLASLGQRQISDVKTGKIIKRTQPVRKEWLYRAI